MSEVKTSRTLQVSEILRGDPCYTYSRRLRDRFTGEIEVTVKLAVSQSEDWDWYWAASRLLTEAGYEKFSQTVREANEKQEGGLEPLKAMGRAAHQQARIEYNRVLEAENQKAGGGYGDASYRAANQAYSEVTEVIDAANEAASKVVRIRVNKVAAEAFATLYIGEEGTEEQTGNDKWYGRDDDYDSDEDSYDENEDY